jgi:hypothetical protein
VRDVVVVNIPILVIRGLHNQTNVLRTAVRRLRRIEKLPLFLERVFYFVETRGIGVASKNEGCRGLICIFRL